MKLALIAAGTLAAQAGNSIYVSSVAALTLGTVAAFDVERIALDSTTTTQTGDARVGAMAGQNAMFKAEAGAALTVRCC